MLYAVITRLRLLTGAWLPAALLAAASCLAAPATQGAQTTPTAAGTPAPGAPAQATPAGQPTPSATSSVPPANSAPADASTPVNPAAGTASEGATGETATGDTRALDQEVQGLKKDVVDLNRELFVLEEELLFPANTQVAVFLSMDVGDFFALDSVTLKIDQKEVINYLYTPREVEALLKGGVHRLYLGNLKVGKHELVAFFGGKGPNDRDYKRGATLRFEKGIGAKYLELKINDRQRRQQPEFEIKDWE